MKQRTFGEKLKLIVEILMAIAGAIYSVYSMPGIMGVAMGRNIEFGDVEDITVITMVSLIAMVVFAVILFYIKGRRKGVGGIFRSIGRILGTLAVFAAGIILLSFILGILSVAAYGLLKNSLSLEEIKGILNYVSGAMMVLILPLYISIFWAEAKSQGTFLGDVAEGVLLTGKEYLRLLLVAFLLLGEGLLIGAFCNNIAADISVIAAIGFLTLIGIAVIVVSEKLTE